MRQQHQAQLGRADGPGRGCLLKSGASTAFFMTRRPHGLGIFFDEISTFNYIFFLKMDFFSQMCTQCRPLLNCCSKFFDDILRSNLSLLSRLNP